MTKPVFVYLAGPVTGHEGNPAIETWRDTLRSLLLPGIVGVSPLRFEPVVKLEQDPIWGCAHSIWHKNRLDVAKAEAVVAYLPANLNTRVVSVGTLLEIGLGIGQDKPVIVVSTDPRVTDNKVLTQAAGWVVPTLAVAADIVNGLFGVYTQ